jgi:segregation and condensation protein A
MPEYKVQFDVFEGPLDLLLYLIKKEEVDIYAVNLTKLATQFLEYVELMRQFDLEVAGEFLVMASTLMYIKSRELLPVEQQAVAEGEEEEGEDPRWELIRQLVEYKKFKDAAAQLQTLEGRQENVYPRVPAKIEFATETTSAKPEVGIFDLLTAVNGILKRFADKEAATRQIFEDKWTVSEKIEMVQRLVAERASVKFSELFEHAANRAEVICTFLALLELIRLKQLTCIQSEPFAEIQIGPPLAPSEPVAATETQEAAPQLPSPESETQRNLESQSLNEAGSGVDEEAQAEPAGAPMPESETADAASPLSAAEPAPAASPAEEKPAANDNAAQPPPAPDAEG